MEVAVSGHRGSCITHQVAPDTYLFAVANGFGHVEDSPVAANVLERLQTECIRRLRRAKNPASALSAAIVRVNDEVHARTASHEDYVTAGCSLTAVVLTRSRAVLAHVGSTAAYLARDGYLVALTKNDTFDGAPVPVLMRALGVSSSVEFASCTFGMNDGDMLVLSGRRLRERDERRRVADSLEGLAGGDPLLVVRYADRAEPEQVPKARGPESVQQLLVGVFATMLFTLLCIAHAF